MQKLDIVRVREEIERLRPSWSYEQIGEALGVERPINPGIIWKLHNVTDYEPTDETLHALGIRKDPRRRYRISVDAETHTRIQRRAERAGLTMGEWVQRMVRDEE